MLCASSTDACSPDPVRGNGGPDGSVGLEQLEGPWLELMQSRDPESVALAFRLTLAHLAQTSKRLQMADVIQSVEEGATASKAVRHQRLQEAAKDGREIAGK